jgi:hypothetical protein
MSSSLILIHIGLGLTVFCLILNGHLRRANRTIIDVTLGFVWLNLLGVALISLGWKVGATALFLSLLYAVVSRPIAVLLARRSLGYWTTFHSPFISSASNLSGDAMLAQHKETERRIEPIAQRPTITKVLSSSGMKPEDLREQFHFLVDIGLGAVARDVISNGKQLRRLLAMRRRQLSPQTIAARLMRWRWYVLVLCPYFKLMSGADGELDFRVLEQFPVLLEFLCR